MEYPKLYNQNEIVTLSLERYHDMQDQIKKTEYDNHLQQQMANKLRELGWVIIYNTSGPSQIMLEEDWYKTDEGKSQKEFREKLNSKFQ